MLHVVFGDFIDSWVEHKPFAQIQRGTSDARLIDKHINSHLFAGINHFSLIDSVIDQVFAVND